MARIFNLFSFCLAIALFLFACAPRSSISRPNPTTSLPAPHPIASPTSPNFEMPVPSPAHPTPEDQEVYPPVVWSAIEDLSRHLEMSPNHVRVIFFQVEEWPDSCLGLAAPDEMCLQVITPGYLVLLEANGQRYEYHTDQSGDVLRVIGNTVLEPLKLELDVDKPTAILAALQALNQATDIDVSEIKISSIEPVQWTDSCLGLAGFDEICAEVITPGWIIILESKGNLYIFHTDLSGENIRQK